MLLKTGACFTTELEANCPTIVNCVTALPVGPAAVAGTTQVLGKDGQFHALPADSDTQTLSIAGNTVSISNGNSITLPVTAAPTPQTLALAGNALSISGGNTVTLPTAAAPDGSETKVTAGAAPSKISVSGTGTAASPYVISDCPQSNNVGVLSTNVNWADNVPNPAGSERISNVSRYTATNNSCGVKKVLVQYTSRAVVHGALSPTVGVLGYPEIDVGASGTFSGLGPYGSWRTIMQCSSGGFNNEAGFAAGSGAQVFTLAPSTAITIDVRTRLLFFALSTGNSNDIAGEESVWTFSEYTQ